MTHSQLYTKRGDGGTTSLADGTRTDKHSLRVSAYGTVDELNAHVGLLASLTTDSTVQTTLAAIQQHLFDIGSVLALAPAPDCVPGIQNLEREIDRLDAVLPPLRTFILPNGCIAACQAHVCRTVCRRAERIASALPRNRQTPSSILAYMNRLSDYFFVLARYLNLASGTAEKTWRNPCR